MPFYCVIRYEPDANGETMNVGVVAFDDSKVILRVLKNWKRVQQFVGHDCTGIRDSVEQFKDATPDLIRRASENWINSIQLSEPAGSLLTLEELADFVEKRFLIERE
jgi:hypothetical protein